jgi:hypothetical protein
MVLFRSPIRLAAGALILVGLLTFVVAFSLPAQQAPVQTQVAAAPASVTIPAPAASPLFAVSNADAPTIASAQAANSTAMNEGGNHTIVVSTLVLVLGVIILVLLID